MAEIQDLIVTDSSNTGRWPENMQFSAVNDAGRADEGLLARWYHDTDSSITASGSSNAFAITSNRVIASYFNNLVMAFTANFSITGACTLNLNGIGAKSLKRYNGTDLTTGDIISGQPVLAIYKSSGDQWFMMSSPASVVSPVSYIDFTEAAPGNPAADTGRLYAVDSGGTTLMTAKDSAGVNSYMLYIADQTQMEGAASLSHAVTPGRQHMHPGHPKGWINFNGISDAVGNDYGVTSITDNGTGDYSINWDTAFSNSAYTITGICDEFATDGNTNIAWISLSTTAARIAVHYGTSAGGRRDVNYVSVIAFGDQ